MKKRLMCLILALCTLLSLAPVAIAEEAAQPGFDNFKVVNPYQQDQFPDVSIDDWFFENVVTAYAMGLMKGNANGTFNPNGSVTIAEAVAIAARLHSIYTTGAENFVQGTPWYQVYADYAYQKGIFSGAYTLNNANEPATRWEFAMILASALPEEAYEAINTVADEAIPDVSLADTYGPAVYKLYRAGITIGSDSNGTFNPESSIRRSEVAAIVTRMAQPDLRQSITLGDMEVPGIFTVTFRLGYSGGGIYDKQLVAEGDRAREPKAPGRSGYTFEGWYTKAEGGREYDFDDAVTENLVLYAHWAEKDTPYVPGEPIYPDQGNTELVYVTFDLNYDGADEASVVELEKGSTVAEPEDPTREGYVFTGWYTDAAAETAFDFSTAIDANLTLYAGWQAEEEGEDGMVSGSMSGVVTVNSVVSLTTDSSSATATVSTVDDCALLVRFVEEDTYFEQEISRSSADYYIADVYASRSVLAGADMAEMVADIQGTLPEYFVAEAVLVGFDDDFNVVELCDPYSDITHTKRYAEYAAKTVYDFEEDEIVLQFTEDTGNNFGVLAEDVKQIGSAKAPVAMTCNEDGSYTLAADLCEDLTVGDKVLIFGEGNVQALIMVSDKKEVDGVVTLTAANADDEEGYYLSDFYQFLKVDMECWADASDVDYSDSDLDNIVFEDEVVSNSIEDIHIDVPIGGSVCPGIKFESDHFKAEGQLEFSLKGNLLIVYDLKLFGKDYFKIEWTTTSTIGLTIDIKAKVENEERKLDTKDGELKLGKLSIPFSVTGLSAYTNLKLAYNWELEGGLHFELKGTYKKGFTYNTNDGRNDINKDDQECKLNLEGSLELKLGPKVGIGFDFLSGAVAAEINCFMGGKIKLEAQVINIVDGGSSRHGCHLCGTGKLMGIVEPAIELKYEITEKLSGTVFKIDLPGVQWTLFSCYLSLVNDPDGVHGGKPKCGKGSCPNESWRTTFVIEDENGDPISGTIKVEKNVGNGCVDMGSVSSQDHTYLYAGNYVASANVDGTTVSKRFVVEDAAQAVVLSADTADGALSGSITDSDSGAPVANATVTIYFVDEDGELTEFDRVKSSDNGTYRVGLPAGEYKVSISAIGYVPFATFATVENGETTYLPISMLINKDLHQLFGGISGTITDAVTGSPIEGVKLELWKGWNNTGAGSKAASFTTDANGEYIYELEEFFGVSLGLVAGNYTLKASKSGYVTGYFNVMVLPGEVTAGQNGALNPMTESDDPDDPVIPGSGDYRVILTWGATPSDLDSHLNALTVGGSREHVYYGSKTGLYSNLDVDDTDSYGPETITVTDFSSLDGGFTYSVHDYTNRSCSADDPSKALSTSGAVVKLYKGDTLLRTYNVPTDTEGTVWNVFSVDGNGKVKALNTFEYVEYAGDVGSQFAQ